MILKTKNNIRFLAGLLASFQDPERLFFVMEFLSGGDLMHHMMLVRHLLPNFVKTNVLDKTVSWFKSEVSP